MLQEVSHNFCYVFFASYFYLVSFFFFIYIINITYFNVLFGYFTCELFVTSIGHPRGGPGLRECQRPEASSRHVHIRSLRHNPGLFQHYIPVDAYDPGPAAAQVQSHGGSIGYPNLAGIYTCYTNYYMLLCYVI
jgi:hypothetical protein